jgi:chemotaxis signal transduction protein
LSPHELPSIRIEVETLAEVLGIEQARIIEPTQHLDSELKEIRYGRSIWRLLLFIALSCLVIESILGRPNTEKIKTKEQ